jgi:hypothetical protein
MTSIKVAQWLFIAACAGVFAFAVIKEILEELTDDTPVLSGKMVTVRGAKHDAACLVARYRDSHYWDASGFPWCTCAWRRTPGKVPGER